MDLLCDFIIYSVEKVVFVIIIIIEMEMEMKIDYNKNEMNYRSK